MLGDEAVASVLYALATGSVDQAHEIIAASSDLDDSTQAALQGALSEARGPSQVARRFGDALRALDAPRHLVNECYRVSFYTGDEWRVLACDPLFAYFSSHRSGRPLDKWPHYFPIYDRHLREFRGASVRVLEIGVYRGGGLELLRHYLGDQAVIVGIDIDEDAARAAGDDFVVEIGDQEDQEFLARVAERHGPLDIVIDDGGHSMRQQISSVVALFPRLSDGGVYIVEDCHTSYWPDYADPDDEHRTFINWARDRIDDLHAYHHSTERVLPEPWATSLGGIHIYDSIVVMDKARRFPPFSELSGTSDYINHARDAQAVAVGLVAAREAAVASRNAALDEASRARAELNDAKARLEADIAHAQDDLAQTEAHLRDSQALVEEMRESTSWQVTAPLRSLMSRLRR